MKKTILIAIVITGILLLSSCNVGESGNVVDFTLPPTPNPLPGNTIEIGEINPNVDDQLQSLFVEGGIPSFSVGIVVGDELVWAKSYGGHAGIDSVYIVGSISKTFTATAILQLYEDGLIDLKADINEYLPFSVRHPNFQDEPITVENLLTNQSGLAMDVDEYRRFQLPDKGIADYAKAAFQIELPELNLDPYPTKEEFYKGLLTPRGEYYSKNVWAVPPGTYQYSNIGYGLLAYIVECVADVSLNEYFHANIYDPLGMDHSGNELAGLEAYHTYPYQRIQGEFIKIPYRGNYIQRFCSLNDLECISKNISSKGGFLPRPDSISQFLENDYLRFPLYESIVGSSGARSSVPDLAKYMLAHMHGGQSTNGYQLLQPESVEMMHAIAAPVEGSINMIPMRGYGMGWTICEEGIEGHIGGIFGYEAEMLIKNTPQGKVGIIFLRNWSWNLADDYENGFEYWKTYHVGIRQILLEEAERLLP
jgi:CubicO group peptidase (beta-lactamase class C family)